MAAPNIVNVASIIARTNVANVITVASDIIGNPASSNTVLKINTLLVTNYNPTTTANISASIFRSSIENRIANNMIVPIGSTLVLISKDTATYLEEGDSIRLTGSANNILWAVSSFEVIS